MKNKVVVLAIFVVLVSLLITLNVIFHESLRGELATIFNKQQELVSIGISNSIETAIDREASKLKFLSGALSEFSIWDREKIQRFVDANFDFEHPMDINVTLFSREKDIIYSTEPVEDISLYTDKAEKIERMKVAVFHDLKRVYAITPLYHGDIFIGGALLAINIKDIATQFLIPFKSNEDGSKGNAFLMDGDGNLLYHPTETTMISNNLYQADKGCFQCHTSFDLEKKVLQGPVVGSGRYIAPTSEDKVLAFSKINVGEKTWIICVTSPYTEVISVTQTSMKLYSGLVVAIFATVFLGGSMIILINRKRIQVEKEAHEAIILENKKLDTIVSAIGAGLMLVDTNNEILWTNKTLTEWSQGELVGEDCIVVCPLCPTRLMSGEIWHDLVKGLFGKKRNSYQITSAPVKNIDGKIVGELKLVQDVTDIMKLKEQVLRSEKLAALGRLVAGVAHEIGNPLTSISSFVQILKKRAGDDFTKDNLAVIYNNIQRITEIVEKMSKFSKLPEMDIKECNINEIIG